MDRESPAWLAQSTVAATITAVWLQLDTYMCVSIEA